MTSFDPHTVEAVLREERFRRWLEQDRKMRIVANIAMVYGLAMILLVVVDAVIKMG
jgi:hypothetical protein